MEEENENICLSRHIFRNVCNNVSCVVSCSFNSLKKVMFGNWVEKSADFTCEEGKSIDNSKSQITQVRNIIERPPAIENSAEDYLAESDAISADWRWLSLRCERRLNEMLQNTNKKKSVKLRDEMGCTFDIKQFSCFVPRTVLEAIADKRIRSSDYFDIIIEQFTAAVVFCDASGFTALTEALDKQPNGAERLGECINMFFDPLINIVHHWGGDIIKFSGDALTVVWPVDDETLNSTVDKNSDNFDYLIDDKNLDSSSNYSNQDDAEYKINMKVACKLALQCCFDLHNTLHNFPTPLKDKVLTLHIGVGFGKVTILQVGGIMDRWEYVVAGSPLEEIAIAEPLANSGETVVSPSVVREIGEEYKLEKLDMKNCKGEHFCKVICENSLRIKAPPPLAPIEINDDDVDLLRRYIPPAVFCRVTAGYNVFLNELRKVSVVFICVRGLDVSTTTGSHAANQLMKLTQKSAYTMEGSVNKFLVDDKGVLLLVMFGLPPVYHLDDAIRAVMASLRVIDGVKLLGLNASIGICSGRVWCGTVGNIIRKEYTALGDFVNLAARLMAKAGEREILVDQTTFEEARDAMEFKQLPTIKVKGKENLIAVYMPTGVMKKMDLTHISKEEMPLLTWPDWQYKKQLYEVLLKNDIEKKFNMFPVENRPPLDYPVACGPLFLHEWFDPYVADIMRTSEIGGVVVLKSKEVLGSFEMARMLLDLGKKKLNRQCFYISNMPDSPHMNIGNVPLLAWRKLCTEIIERWRVAENREKKGYSKIDRDNSVYGLTKELIHPSFHWRLNDMKQVIHDLILPWELPENKILAEKKKKEIKEKKMNLEKKKKASKFFKSIINQPANWITRSSADELEKANNLNPELSGSGLDKSLDDDEENFMNYDDMNLSKGDSIAPIIGSLVNGFTLYESSIIILHVRTGTSLFAEMDKDSWRIARIVARVAMVRRLRKLDVDVKDIKEWRRLHSRKCMWCKGYRVSENTEVEESDDDGHNEADGCIQIRDALDNVISVQPTQNCKPTLSQLYKPLLFVLISSDSNNDVPEQQQLIKMAKDCDAYICIDKLTLRETASFMAHSLKVPLKSLPQELIMYVHRISAGIPKCIHLTVQFLLKEKHITIETLAVLSDKKKEKRKKKKKKKKEFTTQ